MNPQDRLRLETLMPIYLKGRAHWRDLTFIETALDDPEVQAMVAWHQGLAQKMASRVNTVSHNIGKAGLMQRIRAQKNTEVVPPPVQTKPPRLKKWLVLDNWRLPSWQVPAFAALALVVMAQSALLYQKSQVGMDEYGSTRGAASSPTAMPIDRAILKVNFKDETPEQNFRLLLINAGVSIVDGPSQLGDYVLSVPTPRAQEARQMLETSQWVNAVTVVKSAPSLNP
jgi:hypothetical protein